MSTMSSAKLLIVEDDKAIATMLKVFFKSRGAEAMIAGDGRKALACVDSFCPDLIVLDIVLPFVDGLSVLDTLRKKVNQTPVILLTDKGSVEERLEGFEHGADDYVTKPFSPKELWMRVQAVLRRSGANSQDEELNTLTIGELTINPSAREVTVADGAPLSFTKTEFDLLYYLVQRKEEVVSHAALLKDVMGYSPTSETKALVIHIGNIRKKLSLHKLQSVSLPAVPGVGYKITHTPS